MEGDQYAALKSAVQGSTQLGSPTSPLGNFPELAKLYSSSFQLPLSNAATAVQSNNTALTVKNQQDQQAAAQKQQQDMLDPSKYQRIPAQDGGWNFIAPNGQSISAYDYARVTGKSLTDVLANSSNPIDSGFTQDYNNLQKLLNDVRASGNDTKAKAAVANAIAAQPALKKYQNDIPGLIQAFQQHYPTVFGGNVSGNQPVNKTFVPQENTKASLGLGAGGSIGG